MSDPIKRRIDRAMEEALNPKGMSTHSGKVVLYVGDVRHLQGEISRLTVMATEAEALREKERALRSRLAQVEGERDEALAAEADAQLLSGKAQRKLHKAESALTAARERVERLAGTLRKARSYIQYETHPTLCDEIEVALAHAALRDEKENGE